MLNIILFGAPGSGKGTQSENLIAEYKLAHISTGDALRAEIKNGTKLGQLADNYIKKGELVPDDVIIAMLANILDAKQGAAGVIFDGFPRTLAQGEALDKMLQERGEAISGVISLDVDEDELIKRLLKRGEQTGRSDDNMETIKQRLQVYKNQTSPLKEKYKEQSKLHEVKGVGSVSDIFKSIKAEIKKFI